MPTPVTLMPSPARPGSTPRITARLIAWEGGFGDHVNEQRMVKEYTTHLRESITEAVEGTGWRYQRFKTYKDTEDGKFKLEVCRRRAHASATLPLTLYPLTVTLYPPRPSYFPNR